MLRGVVRGRVQVVTKDAPLRSKRGEDRRPDFHAPFALDTAAFPGYTKPRKTHGDYSAHPWTVARLSDAERRVRRGAEFVAARSGFDQTLHMVSAQRDQRCARLQRLHRSHRLLFVLRTR